MPLFTDNIEVISIVDPNTKEDIEFDKPYLLLLTPANEYEEYDDSYKEYDAIAMRGRKAVFDYLMSNLGNDDLVHSYILSGKLPLGKEVSLYTFLRLCITKYFAKSTEFSVETLNDYAYATSNVNQDLNLDILFTREANKKK